MKQQPGRKGSHDRPAIGILTVLPRSLESVRPASVRAGKGQIEWSLDAAYRPGLSVSERMSAGDSQGFITGAPGQECLDNFLKLARATDEEEFVRYAAEHGVLGLSAQGVSGVRGSRFPPMLADERGCEAWHYEPIILWKAYAQNAMMLLSYALALRRGEPINELAELEEKGLPEDALVSREQIMRALHALNRGEEELFFGYVPELTFPMLSENWTLENQRSALSGRLQEVWLGPANITLAVKWEEEVPNLTLALNRQYTLGYDDSACYWPENTLFSVIAAELAAIICTDQHIGQCYHCLRSYPSQRKIPSGHPRYCSDECRNEARKANRRASSNKHYAKKKKKAEPN